MIFTKLAINNLYSFDNFEIDLTYKRKLADSAIEDEFLVGYPKFNFKRICILAGANASGKTSFGKILCGVQNILVRKLLSPRLNNSVTDKSRKCEIIVEFVTTNDYRFHKCYISFSSEEKGIENIKYASIKLWKNDSVAVARERLEKLYNNEKKYKDSVVIDTLSKEKVRSEELEKFFKLQIGDTGWYYLFSENTENSETKNLIDIKSVNKKILFAILNTFDKSIVSVMESMSGEKKKEKEFNGFQVKFNNADTIFINKNGVVDLPNRLSKGTHEAIYVANFIASISSNHNRGFTYYLDERMAYSHSSTEQVILNVILNILSRKSQFFYTTHNCEILDMNLPVHSYVFFRKNKEGFTEVILPERSFSKNDRSLLNAMQNDIFNVLPDASSLEDLFLR